MEKFEIRRKRLRQLIDDRANGNNAEFARMYGYERAQISQYLSATYNRGRTPGQNVVDELERRVGLPSGWFDQIDAEAIDPWPFPSIPEAEVRSLSPEKLNALQGAMALAIAQLKLGIKVAPPPPAAPRSRGGLADLDSAADEFPMRIEGLPPAPWEPGGVTTKQMEREQPLRISRAPDVGRVVDSGYSANDHEFLPVPELDVRLAAGSLGIENYHETQIGEILLRRSFLESFGLPIDRMTIVYADGDSMMPVIRHRSPMLFYREEITDPRQIDPRIVYAINHGGRMIVKCIKRERGGRWLAKSINLDCPPFPLEKEDGREVRIVGRILWSPYDLRNGVDERLL